MKLAAVALVLAAAHTFEPSDAGLPPAVYAERAQLLEPGGNWVESQCFETDAGTACDGAWLPRPRLMSEGAELADLRAQNASLRATPPLFDAKTWVTIAVFLTLGLLIGGYLSWTLKGLIDGR